MTALIKIGKKRPTPEAATMSGTVPSESPAVECEPEKRQKLDDTSVVEANGEAKAEDNGNAQ